MYIFIVLSIYVFYSSIHLLIGSSLHLYALFNLIEKVEALETWYPYNVAAQKYHIKLYNISLYMYIYYIS